MDNNTNQESTISFLKNAMSNIQGFIQSVESGNGLNLTEEQKKEFKEKFEREGGPDLLKQLNEKREQLSKIKL